MSRVFWFLLALLPWIMNSNASNKHNITLSHLSTCKEYIINDAGYSYKEFIDITTFKNNRRTGNERFRLKFIVMMGMSGHILFSTAQNPTKSDWVYEFALGGWQNAFCAYRLKLDAAWLWQKPSPSLLGEFDPLPFEVVQTSDGLISISIPGSKRFLYYFDKSPLTIRYVAFSAHDTAKYARWYYDCLYNDSIMTKTQQATTNTVQSITYSNPVLLLPNDDNTTSKNHYYFMYYNYYNNYV